VCEWVKSKSINKHGIRSWSGGIDPAWPGLDYATRFRWSRCMVLRRRVEIEYAMLAVVRAL